MMILTHEDLSAIEASFGPEKAASIISAFEKLEREQKIEVKKDLLMELATKADIAELRGATKADIAELREATKADIAELRGATKADIAELRGATKADIERLGGEIKRVESDLKGEIRRLEILIKVLIALVVVAMGLFSPAGVELIRLFK